MTYYISTSIPYVNAAPHLGHALEYVQADTFARYRRLSGVDTYFLTGTDENSLNNALAAEREGVLVRELVERYSDSFRRLTATLGISNDDFIRTSVEARHLAGVRKFWDACRRAGDVDKRSYRGLYCVGCEQYYTPEELVDGLCPEHRTRPQLVEEENYFFRLSRYADRLATLIDSGELRIIPESRRNEVRSFLAGGLADISISRSLARAHGWGIPVPDDPSQVIYVWFDALTNYITALGYADDSARYRRYWRKSPRRVHAIGKGILRFHAIYWPAMLLSAGEPLPAEIFVHGYLTIDGQKISKSLGNTVDPFALVQRYGVDPVRYWLLRDVPPTGDVDYTAERLEQRYTTDLANGLGNLLHRSVSLLHRYRQGIVPSSKVPSAIDQEVETLASDLAARIGVALGDSYDPRAALSAIWELVARANRYVQETTPWTLAQAERNGDAEARDRLNGVLGTLIESLRIIAEALRPFLPETAERIAQQLGMRLGADWIAALAWCEPRAGSKVAEPRPLFPRLKATVRLPQE